MRRPARDGHDGGAARRRSRRRRRRRRRRPASSSGSVVGASTTATDARRAASTAPARSIVAASGARSAHVHRDGRSCQQRRAPIGRHRTASSRPVTLNATWVAIDMPRRPVTSRQAPATRPNANRPGYSTGRKWMSANHAAGDQPRRRRGRSGRRTSPAAARGRRAPRRSGRRRRPSARAAPSSPRSARSTSFSAFSDSWSSENVSGQISAQREVDERDERRAG